MRKGVTWAKWDVVDFLDGTVGLPPELGWPYTVILMLIYRDGGATRNDPAAIGRRCGMRPTSVAKAILKLLDMGKLVLLRDDRLTNERASVEIAKVVEKSDKSRSAIRSRWEKERAIRQQLQRTGDRPVVRPNSGRNTEGIPRKEIREVITTSETVSARAESAIDRASSSGLEGPPTRSDEPPSLIALADERRDRLAESLRRMGREPTTTKRIAEAR